MIKLLAIPVAGTIAALVAILLAHPEREGASPRREFEPPPFHLPEEEPELPVPPEDEEEAAPPVRPPPAPEPREFHLQLEADGALLDLESREVYADAEALAQDLGDAPHTLVIVNGEGVGEEALDQALARLRDRFLVRKVYRAREAQPEEEEPGEEEEDADK